MILKELEPKIDEKEHEELYPRYSGQSLSDVPYTMMDALGINHTRPGIKKEFYKDHIDFNGINKVALIVLDGFGYRLWLDSKGKPGFFDTLADKGLLLPITTVFPSTTAAAITSINTGLTPLEHGLMEWVLYMKEIRMIINTLPFTSFMPTEKPDLAALGVDAKLLYDGETVYQQLAEQDVSSTTISGKAIFDSAYTHLIKEGSKSEWYVHPSDAVLKLKRSLESEKGKSYTHLYIDNIDANTHNYGPFTEESRAEIHSISHILKTQLLDKVDKKVAKETLIMVSADHGHTTIDPNKVSYLTDDKKLYGYFATDRGVKILPTGSIRGVFLHITESKIEEAKAYLEQKFAGSARVLLSQDAIKMGLFGKGKQHKQFSSRVGDILVLPDDGKGIWYEHVPGKKHKYLGVHGGLSKNEMLIPLGMARLSDLL